MSRVLLVQMNAVLFNPTRKSLISVSNVLMQHNCSAVEIVYTTLENPMCSVKSNIIPPKLDYPIKAIGQIDNLRIIQKLINGENN